MVATEDGGFFAGTDGDSTGGLEDRVSSCSGRLLLSTCVFPPSFPCPTLLLCDRARCVVAGGGLQVGSEACAILAAALTDTFPDAKRECCSLLLRMARVCPGELRSRMGKARRRRPPDLAYLCDSRHSAECSMG